ncbi:PstS family phosphate ABC transporter substrate-binding protein [Rhodopirellula sp. MGV]|uniref:PstS family phosphate ABC transporter substrate-binding protein n=1 Tax=Rhodopirellula sp. MGV TaxID=2023130 RepID=UPI000B9653B4|nr:PstS family phosphate ABC transporter substrate-binding protein [Rhodopirellula sp. MGV]OYP32380.1 phosphate-binding protein [Rhodopirellula sp. MGV]PNY35835.1 phosphate-binding protein [Rhodopirellula baltica]
MAIQLKNWTLPLAIAALCVAGCGKKSDTASTEDGAATSMTEEGAAAPSNMAGTIKINGSSTVLPISNAVAEQFGKQYPEVSVSVDGAGTGNGFKDFQVKKTDISDASRPIKPGEKEKCTENEVSFIEVPVAYDGLTIVINPKNDWVETLTIEQLTKIFVGEDAAKTWQDVDPSWPAEKIDIYAPGTGSGTYDYFHEVVVGKSDSELRKDMSLNEDDNILVKGVADNKNAIGFFGVAYYEESKDKLKAVQIINPKDGQAYLPTTDNIASGSYAPFSRPLFIYVSLASLKRAEVQTFVSYYLDNVSELCERVGYVRLPASIIEKGKANIENRVAGTHYISPEGETRSGALEDVFVESNLVK